MSDNFKIIIEYFEGIIGYFKVVTIVSGQFKIVSIHLRL